jgi:hypothetical protein
VTFSPKARVSVITTIFGFEKGLLIGSSFERKTHVGEF